MELWVSGFNAWGQLNFSDDGDGLESRDLKPFKCVLQDEKIELLRTSLSATLRLSSHNQITTGSPDGLISYCLAQQDNFTNLVQAGNDRLVNFSEIQPSIIENFLSLEAFPDNGTILKIPEELQRIVANQTTFTALSKEGGRVYTWGDGRYPNCLGRLISEECPADIPSIVEDLADLPGGGVRKISSGGYVTAALTDGNDLYVWGGRAGQKTILEGLGGSPIPIDLNGEDLWDVAVGLNHILAVTTSRKLFVVGEGGNGQLGLDDQELEDWVEVRLPLEEGQTIMSVHAGYKNSFVLVANES
ncbi:uncharacterized protein RSE6_01255 [Rhynchosporium secalis]|uniref:Alpha-tubulin suppressor n=1 Tax=Rhynchosporium secalis TaxID=38038 RepID=A0A1E1LXF4_RHYSE|nr:uncharacterized protein RSE6_01255 [Rhynchosporium secalis]